MVIILQITGHYVDQDVQFIAVCLLVANVLLDPILHSIVRRPVRRAILLLIQWLVYVLLGCKTSLHPTIQIGKDCVSSLGVNIIVEYYAPQMLP